jgi:hypothetical protein
MTPEEIAEQKARFEAAEASAPTATGIEIGQTAAEKAAIAADNAFTARHDR